MGDRKRKHCWNNHVKQKSVEAGISGLFITCEGIEKRALAEAYNLIDEIMGEPENKEDQKAEPVESDEEEDIADSIKKACQESRDQKPKLRRCHQRPTGVKNCLFVTVKGANVVELAEKMVEAGQAAPRCRFLQRVLPVEETADFDLKKLNEMIVQCVGRHLVKREDGSFPSYALEFKARNNDSLKKTSVLEMLNDAVNALAPSAKVDLTNGDITFWVQLVRKTLMVAGVPKFYARRKYNMRPQQEKTAEKPVEKSADVVVAASEAPESAAPEVPEATAAGDA